MSWNNLSRHSAPAAFLVRRKQLKARSCVLLLLGVGRGRDSEHLRRSVRGKHRVGSNGSSVKREGSILEGKLENRVEGTR